MGGDDHPATSTIAGVDRFDTAAALAAASHPDGADTVVVAAGFSFPDTLAASGAAGALDAPVLLADERTDEVPQATLGAVGHLAPDRVILAGGEAVLGAAVKERLRSLADWQVDRVAGDDRYATAAAFADLAGVDDVRVIVASGEGPADALAVGPVAYRDATPLLLTRGDALPEATAGALAGADVEDVVVGGGECAVADHVAAEIGDVAGVTPRRVAGDDRYATATAIAEQLHGGARSAVLATGHGPDGVPADALASAALLPVNDVDGQLPDAARHWLADRGGAVDEVVRVGGASAVNPRLLIESGYAAAEEELDVVGAPQGCPSGWVALTFNVSGGNGLWTVSLKFPAGWPTRLFVAYPTDAADAQWQLLAPALARGSRAAGADAAPPHRPGRGPMSGPHRLPVALPAVRVRPVEHDLEDVLSVARLRRLAADGEPAPSRTPGPRRAGPGSRRW